MVETDSNLAPSTRKFAAIEVQVKALGRRLEEQDPDHGNDDTNVEGIEGEL